MTTPREGRELTLNEAFQLRRRNIALDANNALDTARLILDDEELPEQYAALGIGLAQVALVAEGMEARHAIHHNGGFFFQEKDERLALLAIRDAADRLLAYSASVIDNDD